MRFVPRQRKKVILNLIAALTAILGVTAYISSDLYFEEYVGTSAGIISKLTAFACLIAAVFVLSRYCLAEFQYVIRSQDDGDVTGYAVPYGSIGDMPYYLLDLAVFKAYPWQMPVVQCVLSVGDLHEVIFVGNDKAAKREIREKYKAENGGKFVCYDYTLTPGTEDAIELIFADGERYIGVLLEADEQMRAFFEAVG